MIMFRFFAASVCAALALDLVQPARAEVTEQDDRGFVTRDSATVSASPYEVWQALLSPGNWWDDDHTWSGDSENMYISAQANGCFCELLPERSGAPDGVRRGSAQHMTVVQADPPRVLRMRGGLGPLQSEPVDGVLTITMAESGDNTQIVWEYVVGGYFRFEVATIAEAVDGVMSQQLAALARSLGTVEDEPEQSTAASGDPSDPAPEDSDAADDAAEAPRIGVDEAFGDLSDD